VAEFEAPYRHLSERNVESHDVRRDILDVKILIRDVLDTKQEWNSKYKM